MNTITNDVFQMKICPYLKTSDLGILSLVSKDFNKDINDKTVWSMRPIGFIPYSHALGSVDKKEYAMKLIKSFLNYHYFDNSKIKHDTDGNMQIQNWQNCKSLLQHVSKCYKMHPRFFNQFHLDFVENIFLGCILRNHKLIEEPLVYQSQKRRYSMLLKLIEYNKLEYRDMKYIYCLHEISSYAEGLRNRSIIMFNSIKKLLGKEEEYKLFDLVKYNRNLMYPTRDYKNIILCCDYF